jgi:K+-sensing histidine kinase KdpD
MRIAKPLHAPTIAADQRGVVVAYAAIVPLLLCAAVSASDLAARQTTAALLVVVVIVAAAATGIRAAGVTATLSGTLWFDYFLTAPTGSFSIDGAGDVQTAVLLLVVGLTVTELAVRRRAPSGS